MAVVTVLTKPYPCPGRCVYCPTDARAPKSYVFPEPPVQRALQNDYDPAGQVQERLQALENTGHCTDKVELIVKGGTWSFYPEDYRRRFLQRCFDAATGADSADLAQAHAWNETAQRRIVGLTVETRPDYVNEAEIRRLREFGVTRVELGVQSLEDRVLALTKRDHAVQEVAQATRLLRDAGFKIAYHLMPNLPGATPDDDRNTFKRLFEDPAFRPDALKIYPCVVLESAELFEWWQQGRFQPYDDETLLELLVEMKRMVPPYVRIERVVRDIAAPPGAGRDSAEQSEGIGSQANEGTRGGMLVHPMPGGSHRDARRFSIGPAGVRRGRRERALLKLRERLGPVGRAAAAADHRGGSAGAGPGAPHLRLESSVAASRRVGCAASGIRETVDGRSGADRQGRVRR